MRLLCLSLQVNLRDFESFNHEFKRRLNKQMEEKEPDLSEIMGCLVKVCDSWVSGLGGESCVSSAGWRNTGLMRTYFILITF